MEAPEGLRRSAVHCMWVSKDAMGAPKQSHGQSKGSEGSLSTAARDSQIRAGRAGASRRRLLQRLALMASRTSFSTV